MRENVTREVYEGAANNLSGHFFVVIDRDCFLRLENTVCSYYGVNTTGKQYII